MKGKDDEKELRKLQVELCRVQDWVKAEGVKVIIVFEGRDAAGRVGLQQEVAGWVSPRVFRVVAAPMEIKPDGFGVLSSLVRPFESARPDVRGLRQRACSLVHYAHRRGGLNCIAHIVSLLSCKKIPRAKVKLPKRPNKNAYDDQASLKGGALPSKGTDNSAWPPARRYAGTSLQALFAAIVGATPIIAVTAASVATANRQSPAAPWRSRTSAETRSPSRALRWRPRSISPGQDTTPTHRPRRCRRSNPAVFA